MPIFRVKSVKIYTGQKNLHWLRQWRQWQLSGMEIRWTTLTNPRQNFNKYMYNFPVSILTNPCNNFEKSNGTSRFKTGKNWLTEWQGKAMIGLGSNKWKNTEQIKETFRSLWDLFGTTLERLWGNWPWPGWSGWDLVGWASENANMLEVEWK